MSFIKEYQDLVDQFNQYEAGKMNTAELIEFYAKLIKRKFPGNLGGCYKRNATSLIEDGWITTNGEITDKTREEFGCEFFED